MLSEEQIKQALHAHSVRALGVANLHGPLGLEQLAEAVARLAVANADLAQVEDCRENGCGCRETEVRSSTLSARVWSS